jgi:hypothetical protein
MLQVVGRGSDKIMSQTLNNLAFDIRKETQSNLPKWLNLTRPYLSSQVIYESSTVNNLTAYVGFHKRVAFAKLLEEGGTRKPKGRAIAIPTRQVKKTAKGGISNANRPRALLQKAGVFSGVPESRRLAGIWQATKRIPLRALYVYKQSTKYEPGKMQFRATANRLIDRKGAALFERNINRFLDSLKR